MVNVKKRKGRVVIDSDSEDSASDDNLDQVIPLFYYPWMPAGSFGCQQFEVKLIDARLLASFEQEQTRLKLVFWWFVFYYTIANFTVQPEQLW